MEDRGDSSQGCTIITVNDCTSKQTNLAETTSILTASFEVRLLSFINIYEEV